MTEPTKSCPAKRTEVVQCKTCPWRVGADPHAIPAYVPELHRKLDRTIQSGVESAVPVIKGGGVHIMACHYSKPDDEFACAGWLENQIGPGNNLGVRLMVLNGRLPVPKTDGPQHPTFAATLPKKKRARSRANGPAVGDSAELQAPSVAFTRRGNVRSKPSRGPR